MSAPITGGCQCGAVRYRAEKFGRASICHCRMCQKAFGGFVGALVTAHGLEWTRGKPSYFASSNRVKRGFCATCGTPLTYEYGGPCEIAIATLDELARAVPVIQLNPSDKLPFFDALHTLPVRQPGEQPEADAFKTSVVNFQHPDHDTAEWPVRGAR